MIRTAGEIGFCALQQLCERECPSAALCGIDGIDRWGGLLHRGEISILFSPGAAPRSSLAMQIAASVSMGNGDKERSGALVFTPQRTAEEYLRAMSGILAGVNRWRLSRRLVPKSEISEYEKSYGGVVERLKSSGLFIEDECALNPIAWFGVRGRRMSRNVLALLWWISCWIAIAEKVESDWE